MCALQLKTLQVRWVSVCWRHGGYFGVWYGVKGMYGVGRISVQAVRVKSWSPKTAISTPWIFRTPLNHIHHMPSAKVQTTSVVTILVIITHYQVRRPQSHQAGDHFAAPPPPPPQSIYLVIMLCRPVERPFPILRELGNPNLTVRTLVESNLWT